MTPGAALAADGPLARVIEGFQPRAAQQGMADQIARTIAGQSMLVCEAGTGTGKTFAYLVPALLAGVRTIVSTATRTLQDQLFQVDLPRVRAALGSDARVALLKGRANYLCLHRLDTAAGDPQLGERELCQLTRINQWSRQTTSGDIVELADIPEDSSLWPLVTSTVDNCLGQRCPRFEECFVKEARRRAVAADLVVVNHHLLFADMALRDAGFGEILPTAQCVIIDEAHQVPELATMAFGRSLSARQLRELARDSERAARTEAPDMPDLRECTRRLEQAVNLAVETLGREAGRQTDGLFEPEASWADSLRVLLSALTALREHLQEAEVRGEELAACARRSEDLTPRLALYLEGGLDDDEVHWFETSTRGFVLHSSPLSVADRFRSRIREQPSAWVFCSATLAVGGRLDHFRRELGLDSAEETVWESPFDYPRQALLYLPRLPFQPNDARYLEALADRAEEVLAATRGRAFFLFTSYRAMEYCATRLRPRLPWPVLVQGEAPRGRLLEEFRQLGNAVLFGTSTFWEGVDVRGEALSCVIIDKLPFAPPDDPLTRARSDRLNEEGRSAFNELQLPAAVITLKQGAGRLIRDVRDRGVLVLCDPRLRTRGYGRVFLNSLPPMPRTMELEDVRRFFAD